MRWSDALLDIVLGAGPPAGHSKCMGIHAHLAVTSKVLRPLPQGRLGWAVGVHSPSSRLPSSSSPVNTMYQHHVPIGVIRMYVWMCPPCWPCTGCNQWGDSHAIGSRFFVLSWSGFVFQLAGMKSRVPWPTRDCNGGGQKGVLRRLRGC